MSKDYFAHKAHIYDENPDRVDNVSNIANKILDKAKLKPSMHLLDFGSGTGLLLERIAHHVRDIGAMFRRFHEMVNPEGFIAIADLDKEDGSFHTEDTGDYPVFLLIASRR